METLTLRYQGQLLREYPLHDGMTIGPTWDCDIVLHHARVSPARIVFDGSKWWFKHCRRKMHLVLGTAAHIGDYSMERVQEASLEFHTRPSVPSISPEDRGYRVVCRDVNGQRSFLVRRKTVVVGSGDGSHMRLSDRTVSRQHCELFRKGGRLVVRDLGSRNGTFVNGHRALPAVELTSPAIIRVGRSELSVRPEVPSGTELIVESPAMRQTMQQVERFGRIELSTLVLGETGVGKEGVARALHEQSPRAERPFVAVNAGALSESLAGSALFGHVKGAFTGALSDREGAFQKASGGTLFLDEIGELSPANQQRLLRVLECWRVRPEGSDEEVPVNIRLIAATHRNPRHMIEAGTFREDLLYRLCRLVVRVPPLSERLADIEPLAKYFLAKFSEMAGPRTFSTQAIEFLQCLEYRGNVRELRNLVESAAALSDGKVTPAHIRVAFESVGLTCESEAALQAVLARHGGNISAAARALGIPRTTFRDRLSRDDDYGSAA